MNIIRKISLGLIIVLITGNICFLPGSKSTVFGATPGKVTFGVISDTHVAWFKYPERRRLAKAFQFFRQNNTDAAIVAGDLTSNGSTYQYHLWKSIMKANLGRAQLIASMGNHEGNTASEFLKATGNQPSAHCVINGYHFITLSPGAGAFNSATGTGQTQGGDKYSYLVKWLTTQLNAAIAENPSQPIFVFFHHPIRNTFYVSDEWCGSGLETVFNHYPQAVTFAGHIHSPNNHPQSIWQDGGFTAVNTVSLSFFEMEKGMVYGTRPPDSTQCAQGLLVEVNGSVVTIRNYDFISDQYIPQTWVFDVAQPSCFPYTHARDRVAKAPVFPPEAAIRVSHITTTTATINFDQAVMEANDIGDIVHSYWYDFRNMTTGWVEKSFKTWSEYYLLPLPKTITQQATDLCSSTNYEVRIYAIDAFGKTSASYISARFLTK